jgi:hypothetical protein
MKKIIITESQLKKVIDRVLNEEDLTNYNFNNAVQLFLIKKKITDSNNQPVKKDGSIGRLPNSKSAQAIAKYQTIIGVEPDGVFGYDTTEKMKTKFPNDYKLWLECKSEEGDLFDKGAHFLGLDEQSAPTQRPTTQGTTTQRPTTQGTKQRPAIKGTAIPTNLVGKEIILYSDVYSKKPYQKVTVKSIRKNSDGSVGIASTNNASIYFTCYKHKKLSYETDISSSPKFMDVYNEPLLAQLKKDYCMVGSGGVIVPKVDFAANSSNTDVNIA